MIESLEQLEKKRKRCQKQVIFGFLGVAIGFLLVLVGESLGDLYKAFVVVIIITGFVFVGIGFGTFSSLSKKFKLYYVNKITSEILPSSTFTENMGIPLDDIYKSGLLKRGDRSHTEDLIRGQIEGVNFSVCDLKLEEKHVYHTKNGTVVNYIPYFTGRFFQFDFNKEFNDRLFITEGALQYHFPNLKKVELESEEFNKKFKTYCTKEINAFYVLTPPLILAIIELERTNPGTISISINSRQVCVAINNGKDTFTLSLNEKIDDKLVNKFRRDIAVTSKIVRELKLNRNIFKKEA